jgi:hypothetical protein
MDSCLADKWWWTIEQSKAGKMSFTDLIINMRFFSYYDKVKTYLKWSIIGFVIVFYFSYVLYRLVSSIYCWLII